MYSNKQDNVTTENKTNERTLLNHPPPAVREQTESDKEIKANDIKSAATKTSCTSSTDSGVNISDNDEFLPLSIPSSPTVSLQHVHSLPSSISSSETILNNSNDKHTNNSNNIQTQYVVSQRDNNNKIIENSYRDCPVVNNNEDDGTNVIINSGNIDNRLNSVLVDCGNTDNSTRYQKHQNQNNIESENAINISQQPGLPTTTTSSETTSLQHNNEFINFVRRPSSSPSMSSISQCFESNPPSQKQRYNGSPVVSIRSISSTIITTDSDSDLNSDADNYVIKKLGTQVNYAANDPNIPNINDGHAVLNQKVVTSTDSSVVLEPLAALAAIGDRIGAAQALGPGSAAPQRPQIGSIALNNSTDVTFGDKHFYEGPVTIQQFLIEGRDKWKEKNGKDNPTCDEVNENTETSANNAKDIIDPSPEKTSKFYKFVLKRKKLVICGALASMTLLIVVSILASGALNDSKSKLVVIGNSEESRDIVPIHSTIDTNNNNNGDVCDWKGNGSLCFIERDNWRAHPQKNKLAKQKLPLHRVVISHTASEPCDSFKICINRVRVIQEFHMNSLNFDDIGYNFLISSDGLVYVGRGWDYVGAHTKGYNYDSVGISFIGIYTKTSPTEAQLKACTALLEEGVRIEKLTIDYRLYGARQMGATESPGDMLYQIIRKWPHWSSEV